MFWDMTSNERPPYVRAWVGSETLDEEFAKENYLWAHNIGAVELTPTLRELGIINETYMLFRDRIFNWKTGQVYKPTKGVYLLYDSKDGRKNKGAGERVPFNTEDLDQSALRNLPKFPQTQKFTKVYQYNN